MKVDPNIKILQSQGLGTRREIEFFLHQGLVFVNGQPIAELNAKISPGDRVLFGDTELIVSQYVYLALNKPAGFETSNKPSRHRSVFDLLPDHYRRRGIQAAGRLDVDTTGLLLFSDDGQFIHKVISGKTGQRFQIEKTYLVRTAEPIDEHQKRLLLEGVELDDEPEPVRASSAKLLSPLQLELKITTGKYHQVKRMLAAVGNHVVGLHRSQVGPYRLPDQLPEGQYIPIDPVLLKEP